MYDSIAEKLVLCTEALAKMLATDVCHPKVKSITPTKIALLPSFRYN